MSKDESERGIMALDVYLQSQDPRRRTTNHRHQTVTRTQPPVYSPCFTISNGLLQSVSKQSQRSVIGSMQIDSIG